MMASPAQLIGPSLEKLCDVAGILCGLWVAQPKFQISRLLWFEVCTQSRGRYEPHIVVEMCLKEALPCRGRLDLVMAEVVMNALH